MIPSKNLVGTMMDLLAADTGTLAPATANKMVLFKNNIVPNENTVYADLTLADFSGYADKSGIAGAQTRGVDPATGDQLIIIGAPVGGYIYECTGMVNVPQTIYGYALVDHTNTTLIAVQTLPTPVTIAAPGNIIDLGNPKLTQVAQPLS